MASDQKTLFVNQIAETTLPLELHRDGRGKPTDKVKGKSNIYGQTRKSKGTSITSRKEERTVQKNVPGVTADAAARAVGGIYLLVQKQAGEAKRLA